MSSIWRLLLIAKASILMKRTMRPNFYSAWKLIISRNSSFEILKLRNPLLHFQVARAFELLNSYELARDSSLHSSLVYLLFNLCKLLLRCLCFILILFFFTLFLFELFYRDLEYFYSHVLQFKLLCHLTIFHLVYSPTYLLSLAIHLCQSTSLDSQISLHCELFLSLN